MIPRRHDPSLGEIDPETGRKAGCTGKEPFARPQLAWRVARRRKYKGAQIYNCDHCGLFHFGRKPGVGNGSNRKGRR